MDKILKMIEEVDPEDSEKLDEIDARVWCYLDGCVFAGVKHDRIYAIHPKTQCEDEIFNGVCTLRYTRSRDVLKAIRPEGWLVSVTPDIEYDWSGFKGWDASIQSERKCFQVVPDVDALPTEELAELHAIIQAIEYERKAALEGEE